MDISIKLDRIPPARLSDCEGDNEALAWMLVNRERCTLRLDNDASYLADDRWDGVDPPDQTYDFSSYIGGLLGEQLLHLLGVVCEDV